MTSRRRRTFFSEQMLSAVRIPAVIIGIAMFTYILLLSGLIFKELTINQSLTFIVIMAVNVFTVAVIIAPLLNGIIHKDISKKLVKLNLGSSSKTERTALVKQLMKAPLKTSVQITLTFIFCMIIGILFLIFYFDARNTTIIFIIVSCIFCSYNAGVFAYTFAQDLCSKQAMKISELGLDSEIVKKHRFFGISIYKKVTLSTIIPIIFSALMILTYFYFSSRSHVFKSVVILNSAVILILNTTTTILISLFFFMKISKSFEVINANLKSFATGRIEEADTLQVDLSDQISYNIFLINEIISFVKEITEDSAKTSTGILNTISDLTEISSTTAKISEREANSVKDSLMRMEKATELLEKITDRIADVRFTAENTKNTVSDSTHLLEANIAKMSDITDANLDTITGIKNLNGKIESVWEIINTINNIALKTKIIAFNAELEASYAGEEGEKFHIIANEIRRLATTISDSIQEIKEQVTEIQHSADNLIITSEASTQKITDGREFYSELEEQFSNLRLSSDITAESATQIQDSTNNQDNSFIQIDFALREISAGFDKFSSSAKQLNESSEKIRVIANNLNQIHLKESD